MKFKWKLLLEMMGVLPTTQSQNLHPVLLKALDFTISMVISCVGFGCTNRQESHVKKLFKNVIPISFHRFPDPKKGLHGSWLRSVKRWKWTPTTYSYEHFLIKDYKVPPWGDRLRLKKWTVPSVFMFSNTQEVLKNQEMGSVQMNNQEIRKFQELLDPLNFT